MSSSSQKTYLPTYRAPQRTIPPKTWFLQLALPIPHLFSHMPCPSPILHLPLPLPTKVNKPLTPLTLTLFPSVPHFPQEDAKLRATALQIRRGGNCPNTLEVLQQLLLLPPKPTGTSTSTSTTKQHVKTHLISCLPAADAPATRQVLESFGCGDEDGCRLHRPDFSRCLYREGRREAASSL